VLHASVFIDFRQRRVLKGETIATLMLKDASPFFRGVCITATLYAALFLGHIVAAAQDWDILFRVIAVFISVLTFFIAPCITVFGQVTEASEKIRANSFGLPLSMGLAVALAWAYEDQSFDIFRTLSFILLSFVVHFSHRQMIRQKNS
tara:strand:+ start:123 stop:566 length:444 start_codon:yes stop_codon:yes gene_type:complete